MAEKILSGNEIRELFLKFFEEKHQHTRIKSSSLVPDNPTVLLTTAGMLQFMPLYLGYEKPWFSPARATSCQKCARAGGKDSDIENVGRTPRHHTFFEMLGNFAFGDYFKEEIIPWSWDFVTNYLKLDKNRLWITIFENDDESFEIWNKKVGVPAERIIRKGKKDNFWGPPGASGSCGPCSEIHYDLGEEFKCSDDCSIATCECNRWVEIWNLVFTDLFQDKDGTQSPLEKKNVDTGMGLERITMVVQGKNSTFETDLLKPILDEVVKASGKEYGKNEKTDISLRIITDHVRCVSFMIADGVLPANEGVNYVLRMIMRRALRHGKMLGLELPFLSQFVDKIIELYGDFYPELVENKDKIKKVIVNEEEKFKQTLDKGQKIFEEFAQIAKNENNTISGENAFKLYDTYGFPFELTKEIAEEKDLKVDEDGFKSEMEKQKQRAKAAAGKVTVADDVVYVKVEEKYGSTEFTGYDEFETKAKILTSLPAEEGLVDIILDKTPFYAECGGQIGDTGIIETTDLKAEVVNTFKVGGLYIHRANIIYGDLVENQTVTAKINAERRKSIMIHHSNAHLLQAALVKVLGDEVKQAGSQVEETRTRFDFSFSRAMTKKEIQEVEDLINKWISEDIKQNTEVMDIEKAKLSGATALFGEKYGDTVRVVSFGDISKEFCGGTHTSSSADLRLVKIVQETAVSAGSRRIEAVCGNAALEYLNKKANITDELTKEFKCTSDEVIERINKLVSDNKDLSKEIEKLKEENAKNQIATFLSKAEDIEGGKLFVSKVDNFDAKALKTATEVVADKLGNSIVFLVSVDGETVKLISKVSNNFIQKGIKAGDLVRKFAEQSIKNTIIESLKN